MALDQKLTEQPTRGPGNKTQETPPKLWESGGRLAWRASWCFIRNRQPEWCFWQMTAGFLHRMSLALWPTRYVRLAGRGRISCAALHSTPQAGGPPLGVSIFSRAPNCGALALCKGRYNAADTIRLPCLPPSLPLGCRPSSTRLFGCSGQALPSVREGRAPTAATASPVRRRGPPPCKHREDVVNNYSARRS